MKNILTGAALAALIFSVTPAPVMAGPIERACLQSDRRAANRQLCRCIQQAADQTLRNADQRRAATFFRDPDRAHATWMSKRASDDAFWERYKAFGRAAEAYCQGV